MEISDDKMKYIYFAIAVVVMIVILYIANKYRTEGLSPDSILGRKKTNQKRTDSSFDKDNDREIEKMITHINNFA